jgi:hypothetical protein
LSALFAEHEDQKAEEHADAGKTEAPAPSERLPEIAN